MCSWNNTELGFTPETNAICEAFRMIADDMQARLPKGYDVAIQLTDFEKPFFVHALTGLVGGMIAVQGTDFDGNPIGIIRQAVHFNASLFVERTNNERKPIGFELSRAAYPAETEQSSSPQQKSET